MVSSKLSTRRGTAKKPSLCFPPPPPPIVPPPPPPPPPRECWFLQTEFTIEPDQSETMDLWACCESLPEEEHIDIELGCTGGTWDPSAGSNNCILNTELHWQSPDEEGDYELWADLTWSDSGTCRATSIAHVEEEEENGHEEESIPPQQKPPGHCPHC